MDDSESLTHITSSTHGIQNFISKTLWQEIISHIRTKMSCKYKPLKNKISLKDIIRFGNQTTQLIIPNKIILYDMQLSPNIHYDT